MYHADINKMEYKQCWRLASEHTIQMTTIQIIIFTITPTSKLVHNKKIK
jgi:hypothetical protein